MDLQLKGKCAFVVGATDGIGGAVARALAAENVRVMLGARDPDRLKPVADSLGAACVGTVPFDLGDGAAIDAAVNQAESLLGGIDILVNAAVHTSFGTVWEMERANWEQVFRIKYMGSADLARRVAAHMVRRKSGVIVNFTGIAAQVLYQTSPFSGDANIATERFTRFLAASVAESGVRVLGISPGFVRTERLAKFYDAERTNFEATIPLGRIGTPEEIAALATFLVSPKAGYITGTIVAIDGGVSLPIGASARSAKGKGDDNV